MLAFPLHAASRTRMTQNAELASAAHAEVELVFRSVSRGVSDIKVCAREIPGPSCWVVPP